MKKRQFSIKDAEQLLDNGYFYIDPINLDFMIEKAIQDGGYEVRIDRKLKTFRFARKEEKRMRGEVRYNANSISQEEIEQE